jgi:GABA(A) receptor-associated protein
MAQNRDIPFKSEYSFEERQTDSARMLTKYPTRIPVIVERKSKTCIAALDKKKFLIPQDMSMVHFVQVLRRRLTLGPEQGIFIFVGKSVLAKQHSTMAEIYREHADEDGYLYCVYSGENVFGQE